MGDGLLCAGEDDGLVSVLDQIGQRRCGVSQRVGAVADDEAVIQGIVLLYGTGHGQPVLRAEVGAVDAAQSQGLRLAQLLQTWQVRQQLLAGKHRFQPLVGAYTGNGAAGGDKKQTLLGHRMHALLLVDFLRKRNQKVFCIV